MNDTIFLYGPSGTGKTSLGKLLAAQLDLPYHDLDQDIEASSNLTIPEIFAAETEFGFRERERLELEQILAHKPGVIALGGGALTHPPTRRIAEQSGRILLLTASPEILLARLRSDPANPRSWLAGDPAERLKALLDRRSSHYASFPPHLDTSNLTPDQASWEAQVRLGMFRVSGMGKDYDVRVMTGGLDSIGSVMLKRGLRGPVAVVSDTTVAGLYADRVTSSLHTAGYTFETITFPPGETIKTLETVAHLWDRCLAAGVERGSTILALGGGVVGDLAGFAASAWLRGVAWVNVPTTLLAMCDSSLGGKTGFDLPQGKNLVGAFHPPSLVLADPLALASLPEAELRNGIAEAAKQGVIADAPLFELCQAGSDLEEIVRRSMAVKIKIIQEDPYEKGQRAALNLGHTVGHALELVSNFQLKHGEAVAIGMLAETRLAEALHLARPGLSEEISAGLRRMGLPVEIPPGLDPQAIMQAMAVDKKRAHGKIRFALPVKIGEVQVGVEIENLEEMLGLLFRSRKNGVK